ncbi:cytochrome b/b6 domain-containing protein [Shewanella marina]|uniref:cytochrome b/b6 domain-containing protein n=1 Tax=Shewanella marina TaxID=487319 RepID=UPI0004729EB0|nr:cytochrome b/b6 domain-containing protein [Shewanella marina]
MSALLTSYKVWDRPTRIFHWINFLSVISLIFIGLIMLFKPELGISGTPAKIAIKAVHIVIGYIFVINLIVRLVWSVVGKGFASWRAIVPQKGYFKQLAQFRQLSKTGDEPQYLGHNPLAKLAMLAIYLLLITLAITGLVRAGTDIYYPPFGDAVRHYVADTPANAPLLQPYDKTHVNPQQMQQLKVFKKPFGKVHLWAAYLLMFMIVLHIFFVVRTEIKTKVSLVSAMINGNKILNKPPQDKQ